MVEKNIRLVTVFLLAMVYSFVQKCGGIESFGNPWIDTLLHVGVVHLALCCYGVWLLLRGWPWPSWVLLTVGYMYGVAGSYLSPWPVEGMSGVLFAITGIQLAYHPTRDNLLTVVAAFAGCTLIQYGSSVVHGVPLVLGFCTAAIIRRRAGNGTKV